MDADDLIRRLDLEPHPEGGWYRQTWRDVPADGGRGVGTAILFLLREGERSHWHRVDATELWHFHLGAPLVLATWPGEGPIAERTLGTGLESGQVPQAQVRPHEWQAAWTTGPWTLVGCTVAPAFEFERWELAPPDWAPPAG